MLLIFVNHCLTEKNRFSGALHVLAGLLILCLVTAAVVVVGNAVKNRDFKETYYQVGSGKISENMRIIQISDLHDSSYGEHNEDLVSRMEELKPDLIVLTGDIIDESGDDDTVALNLCEQMVDLAPVYYVWGNHETMASFDLNDMSIEEIDELLGCDEDNRSSEGFWDMEDDLKDSLEDLGVHVLWNQYETVQIGRSQVDIYGVLTGNAYAFWQYAEERGLAGLPAGERVVAAGRFFEGMPYEGGTLGDTPEERVVVNLRAFDCVTFVENVLALALTEGRGERTEEAFVGQLVRLRYRDGEARDYASRLHYSSDWLAEMVRVGILGDVTCGLGGERYAPEVNFMTAHAEAYPALKACGALREKMRMVEDSIRARTYYYIPLLYPEGARGGSCRADKDGGCNPDYDDGGGVGYVASRFCRGGGRGGVFVACVE